MSLINKVLQDLDARHAPATTVFSPSIQGTVGKELRPVKPRRVSDAFWYSFALLMALALAWVGWVFWNLKPKPLVTELAYQSSNRGGVTRDATVRPAPPAQARPAAPAAAPALSDARTFAGLAVAPAAAAQEQPAAPLPSPASAMPEPSKATELTKVPEPSIAPELAKAPEPSKGPEAARIDMLRMATELTTPQRVKPARPAAESPKSLKSGKDASAVTAAKPEARLQAAASTNATRIDRRTNATPRDRADAEFRRAIAMINQGRMSEGMDGLRKALQLDPGYEAVRQTLVALLLEGKRLDDAVSALQEGLALNPDNIGFAILLARAYVERNDVAAALGLLQKHAPAAGSSPDYHAFAAALHQRLGSHKEAIDEYRIALQLAPGAGAWWIGLGISQQALNRPKEALDAFKRAKATGNLAPELHAFADQRLKLLQ
jgi:MSHA biogenesis protein MshN